MLNIVVAALAGAAAAVGVLAGVLSHEQQDNDFNLLKGGESMFYEALGAAASVAGVLVGAFVAGVEAGLDFSEEE